MAGGDLRLLILGEAPDVTFLSYCRQVDRAFSVDITLEDRQNKEPFLSNRKVLWEQRIANIDRHRLQVRESIKKRGVISKKSGRFFMLSIIFPLT